ncbi:hypothetical protein D3C83_296650 [compost metagenome]
MTILRHTSIETTGFADGAAFRAGWLVLMREGLTQVNQRQPPVFGTSFTTRMTQTTP